MIALGTSTTEAAYNIVSLSNFLITSTEDPNCMDLNPTDTIAAPNSNAFIDLDGDCLPDLFLTMCDSTDTYFSYRVFVQRQI